MRTPHAPNAVFTLCLVASLLAAGSPAVGADTLAFRNGKSGYAGTHDTELSEASPDESKGAVRSIRVSGTPGSQGLIRFDDLFGASADQIPPGSTIDAASLRLTGSGLGAARPPVALAVHRMLVDWSESSTWNSTGGGIAQDDAESRATPDDTWTITGQESFVLFEGLEETLQTWSDGDPNRGWVVVTIPETVRFRNRRWGGGSEWSFAASELPTIAVRPVLTVEFTAPPPVADLGVTKSVDDPVPTEETTIVYTVSVANDGPDGASGIEVTDVLPAGVSFTSSTATAGSYDDGTGVWVVGNLAVAAAETLLITVSVDAGTAGTTIVNAAAVTASDQGDGNPANDSSSVKIAVRGAGLVEREVTSVGFDQRPAVSPDGQQIAFDSMRSGNRDLWTVPYGGGAAVQLTTGTEADLHPDWSPDGAQLVFSAVVGGANADLYLIPATGGTPVLLDSDPSSVDRFPSWSPDGTTIAYTKGNDIYLIPSAGGTPSQLTTDAGLDVHPSWSPDGTQITFVSSRSGNNDIWVIPAAGGTATQITTNTANDGAPDWSPDGTLIAFQSNRGGAGNEIWVIPATGGTATQVTTAGGGAAQPDWAPNSAQIAFARGGLFVATLPEGFPIAGGEGKNDVAARTGFGSVAGVFALDPARPNPFRVSTAIPFEIAVPSAAKLVIFDVTGRVVRTLVDEPVVGAGRYAPSWDGRDEAGRPAAAGVYLVRLETEGFTAARKLVVTR